MKNTQEMLQQGQIGPRHPGTQNQGPRNPIPDSRQPWNLHPIIVHGGTQKSVGQRANILLQESGNCCNIDLRKVGGAAGVEFVSQFSHQPSVGGLAEDAVCEGPFLEHLRHHFLGEKRIQSVHLILLLVHFIYVHLRKKNSE